MSPKKIKFNQTKIASAFMIVSVLSGCGETMIDSQSRYDSAQTYFDKQEYARAVIELKNVLKLERNHIAARRLLGEVYFEQGLYAEAEKELERAYRFDKSDAKIVFSYAEALLQRGSFDELEVILDAKRAWTKRQFARVQSLKLRLFITRNDEESAKELINSADFKKLTNVEAIYGRVLFYLRDKQLELAQTQIKELLNKVPNHVDGLIAHGDLLFAQKDAQGALTQYQQAKKLSPSKLVVDIKIVQAMVSLNEFIPAEKVLDRLLKQSEVFHQANYYYAYIKLQQKNYDAALTFANKVLNLVPSHSESQYIAAQAAFFLKQYQVSYRLSSRLARKFPSSSTILKLLAANQLHLKDYKAAVSTLQKLPEKYISAKDAPLLIEAARGLDAKEDFATRKELLLKASNAAPQEESSKWGLAFVAFSEGKDDEGNQYLLNALKDKPESTSIKAALISSYLKDDRFDEAQVLIDQLIAADANNPDGHTLQGLLFIQQENKELAAQAFEKALSVSPNDINANNNLASLAILKGDLELAKYHNQQILGAKPSNKKALKQMWLLEQKLGNTNESIGWLKKMVMESPKDLSVNVSLAQQYIAIRDFDAAIKLLQPFDQYLKETLVIRLILGQAYYLTNQLPLALAQFNRAKAIEPLDPTNRYWSALVHEKNRDLDAALESANSALALMPNDKIIQSLMLRLHLKKNDVAASKPLSDELVSTYPKDLEVREYRAKYLLQSGDYKAAVSVFERLFSERKTNLVLVQYANALTKNKQRPLAIDKLEVWLGNYPDDSLVLNVLANEYLSSKKFPAAKKHFLSIVKLQPTNGMAHNNLAWILLKMNNLTLAAKHAQRSLKLLPQSPDVNDTYGQILLANGEYKKSRSLLKLANKKMPRNLETKYHLARAAALDGDKLVAVSLLQQILALKSRRSPGDLIVRRDSESLLRELQQ